MTERPDDPSLHKWFFSDNAGLFAWLEEAELLEHIPGGGPALFDPDHPLLLAEARRRYPIN